MEQTEEVKGGPPIALAGALAALPRQQSEAYRATKTDDFLTPKQVIDQISLLPPTYPEPVGHRILLLALTMPSEVGGIQMIDETLEAKALASPQGVVLKLGPDTYPEDRFPSGPWCQVGDRIMFSKYAGRGYRLANGQLLFVLNDDEVIGIIDRGHPV